MKKILHAALLLAAIVPMACQQTPVVDPEQEEPQKVEPVSLQLTFVLPDEGNKTAWVAGDKIVVHGEYAKDQVTVTLAAGDISADKKRASLQVDKLFPYVREDCASTLYASWPADAVDNLKHCFFYSKFSTTSQQLLAACNDADNTFRFQEVLGALRFSTGSDLYDSFTLTGNKKDCLGYSFMQVKLTDKEQNFKQYVGEPVISLDLQASQVNQIYMPAGTEIQAGFQIKFRKDGKFVKAYKTSQNIVIERGKTVDLGDISAGIVTYDDPFSADILDLDKNGNANSYIITEPGTYKFKAVKGNSATSFLADAADAMVLWETWNNDEEVTPNSVVASVSYAEDYIILHMPDKLHPGNAVIAAQDSDGKILWSWHIWVPQTSIETRDYGIYSAAMMDRNLGALVAATTDGPAPVESFGLSYQWGRKDPFPGPSAPNKSSNATVAGKSVEQTPGSGAADESKITLEESIANPTLLGHTQNGDWLLPAPDSDLWKDSEKTIYDPCPPGYRVPARVTSQPLHSSDLSAQKGWSENKANYWFTLGDPVAVFPFAGYRDDYGPESYTHAYDRAALWTSYASGGDPTGNYVNIRAGSAHKLTTVGKSRGCSVRCVVE